VRALRRSGLAVRRSNLTDRAAAARVRRRTAVTRPAAGGHRRDELRAPSAGQIFDRLRALDPHLVSTLPRRGGPVALASPVVVLVHGCCR